MTPLAFLPAPQARTAEAAHRLQAPETPIRKKAGRRPR